MHEKKGKEPFFFVSHAKLIFSFNQLPLQLEEKSNAFYKRMRILYMNKELFLNNEYVDKLCDESSIEEIIPYLLSLLPVEEIPRTPESEKMVEGLRHDSDSIHAFLSSKCKLLKGAMTPKDDLYNEYLQYCGVNGREAHKKHGFLRNMRSLGYKEARDPETREQCWVGIKLKKGRERSYGR